LKFIDTSSKNTSISSFITVLPVHADGRTDTHDRASGRFTQFCERALKLVDNEQPHRWLKFGYIKGETGSTAVAAGDQEISKKTLSK